MKACFVQKCLCVLLLVLATSRGISNSQTFGLQVSYTIQVEVAVLDVACVEFFGNNNESEGLQLYFSPQSFTEANRIMTQRDKASMMLPSGMKCESLTKVNAWIHEKSDKILEKISANGGFRKIKVGFYNGENKANLDKVAFERALGQVVY
ncbi:MAG: hypothetical protein COT74_02300 [Bdellovibrionales bacterium CG10_big_fil_rev_8_21_14_0_10_45_34]|nr:MAG: hypothetical protein COT74_02300 [Bdellovibrionales bacterium CG10_big_fil_rev_8_21_14_0_10_45_34]